MTIEVTRFYRYGGRTGVLKAETHSYDPEEVWEDTHNPFRLALSSLAADVLNANPPEGASITLRDYHSEVGGPHRRRLGTTTIYRVAK